MRIKEKKIGQHFQYRKRILNTVAVRHDKVLGVKWQWGTNEGKCSDCHFKFHSFTDYKHNYKIKTKEGNDL